MGEDPPAEHAAARLAIVGIDGAGKSTLAARFAELFRPDEARLAKLLRLHEVRDAPLGDLTRDLRELGHVAEDLGCAELKATAHYLLFSLGGPVERFLLEVYRPRVLVHDRHAMVDGLVCVRVYGELMASGPAMGTLAGEIRRRLEARRPGGLAAIERWVAIEAQRLGVTRSLWDYPAHLRALAALEPAALLRALARELRAALPDAVLMVDITAEEAAERMRRRGDARAEIHEQPHALARQREILRRIVGWLREHHPEIDVAAVPATPSPDQMLGAFIDAWSRTRVGRLAPPVGRR
jgi:thymidylate kinase